MNDSGTVRGIQDILSRAYGDLGTSPLDRAAGSQVLQYLRQAGWMSPQEVAVLIRAAGGEIVVPENLLVEVDDFELVASQQPKDSSIKLTSRRKTR